jgi:hypothetical protein
MRSHHLAIAVAAFEQCEAKATACRLASSIALDDRAWFYRRQSRIGGRDETIGALGVNGSRRRREMRMAGIASAVEELR